MKIVHVITLSTLGGAQSVVKTLANSQSINNEVIIISGIGRYGWNGLNSNIKIIRIPQLKREISLLDIIVLIKLFFFQIKYKPDVIHLHSSKVGILGRLAFSKKKTIYTVHGFDSIRIANRKFLFIEKILKYKVAAIVGVSKYDLHYLQEEGIIKKSSYIYNGIEDKLNSTKSEFDNDVMTKIKDVKKQFHHIVLCIARDDKQKKIDLFFDIASKFTKVAFIWIGNEHKYDLVSNNVFLFGLVPSASQYLRYADLFILPSNYEGLPMSIIEALSFRIPVVASNVGGISELLNGSNGFVVENDANEFAKKIEMILSNKSLLLSMGENARSTYLQLFTVDKMAKEYQNLYNQMYSRNNKNSF